jgi:hypothetical protein
MPCGGRVGKGCKKRGRVGCVHTRGGGVGHYRACTWSAGRSGTGLEARAGMERPRPPRAAAAAGGGGRGRAGRAWLAPTLFFETISAPHSPMSICRAVGGPGV